MVGLKRVLNLWEGTSVSASGYTVFRVRAPGSYWVGHRVTQNLWVEFEAILSLRKCTISSGTGVLALMMRLLVA